VKKLNAFLSYLVTLILLLNVSLKTNGQMSIGGTPRTISEKSLLKISELPFVTMPSFDVATMIKEDSIDQKKSKPFRFAKGFDVSLSINNSGKWEILDNGDKIWRLGIKSPGAYSINVIFSEFDIPDGAEVFILNSKFTHLIGAFTSQNKSESGILATTPVRSDKIIVEYYEPKNINKQAKLTIGSIGHAYKDVVQACFDSPQGGSCKGYSLSCEVDDTCSQGHNWQNQKHAVCRIFFKDAQGDYEMCTGALVNNTANNGIPYFLTANHCVCNNDIANTVVVLFNYDSPTCNGVDGPLNQTLSGSTLLSNSANSDFALLQLSSTPPSTYKPYYLGWDNSGNTPGSPVTVIHHPKGDVRKISISTNSVTRSLVNNINNGSTCQPQGINVDTWYESAWTTGATEAGSSGAPLFDPNKRVVGQLYAGPTNPYCNDYSWFGRFSVSWTGGGTHATQLSYWLDPCSSGRTTIDGGYPVTLTGANVVCTSGATFTLNYLPSGYTVNWSSLLSSNLYVVNAVGNTATIAAQSGAYGAGYVQPIINSTTGCSYTLPIFNTWVGPPQVTNQKVDGSYYSPGKQICPGNHWLDVTPIGQGAGNATWTVPSGIQYIAGNNTLDFTFPSNLSSITISASSTNSCGTSSKANFYLSKKTSGCPNSISMTLYPNPASDNVTISIIGNQPPIDLVDSSFSNVVNTNNTTGEPSSYMIRIYNNQSALVSTQIRSGKNFNIPLTNMINGTYIIEVSDGKNSSRQQLIVKHN